MMLHLGVQAQRCPLLRDLSIDCAGAEYCPMSTKCARSQDGAAYREMQWTPARQPSGQELYSPMVPRGLSGLERRVTRTFGDGNMTASCFAPDKPHHMPIG